MLADLTPRAGAVAVASPAFDMLAALRESPLVFHLTGSRYAGTDRPDSDWDFLLQHAPGVPEQLVALGFRVLVGADGDPQYEGIEQEPAHTVEIFVHCEHPQLQVQLMVDVERARTVRDIVYGHLGAYDQALKDRGPRPGGPVRGDLWRQVLDLVAGAQADLAQLTGERTSEELLVTTPAAEDDDALPF